MRRLTLPALEGRADLGLLVLRLGIGFMFLGHGVPKLAGGPDKWRAVGSAVSRIGIDAGHQAFGLAAALAEAGGGALLMLGLLTRLACIPLAVTMAVAASRHLVDGDGFFKGASHAIESGVVFVALFILGAGRYSADALLARRAGGE